MTNRVDVVPRSMERFTDWRVDAERQLAQIALETGLAVRSEAVDTREASAEELRGIPAIGRGVGGMSTESRSLLNRIENDTLNDALRMDWL